MGGMRSLLVASSIACLTWALPAPAAQASSTQETVITANADLIYAPPPQVAEAMELIKSLGVDRIRVSLGSGRWRQLGVLRTAAARGFFVTHVALSSAGRCGSRGATPATGPSTTAAQPRSSERRSAGVL